MADVEETDDAYVIEIELPGVDRKDIDISVLGRRLLVTGERKERRRGAWSAPHPATSATRRAASSPRRSGASRTRCCSSR